MFLSLKKHTFNQRKIKLFNLIILEKSKMKDY